MKVTFSVSSQSIRQIVTKFGNHYYLVNNPENFTKFHTVFKKLDHLTCNAILRINWNGS